MEWTYDDGGREAAGYQGRAGDCVTRSIAIASGLPYSTVYDALFERAKAHPPRSIKKIGGPTPDSLGNPEGRHGTAHLRAAAVRFGLHLGTVDEESGRAAPCI